MGGAGLFNEKKNRSSNACEARSQKKIMYYFSGLSVNHKFVHQKMVIIDIFTLVSVNFSLWLFI